jgi:hypothetical protein
MNIFAPSIYIRSVIAICAVQHEDFLISTSIVERLKYGNADVYLYTQVTAMKRELWTSMTILEAPTGANEGRLRDSCINEYLYQLTLLISFKYHDRYNVLHPRTGHTTEPVKIPYGLPLTTNYIHNIRDINTIGTVL